MKKHAEILGCIRQATIEEYRAWIMAAAEARTLRLLTAADSYELFAKQCLSTASDIQSKIDVLIIGGSVTQNANRLTD